MGAMNEVKRLLTEKGLKQNDLATYLGVPPARLTNWIHGRNIKYQQYLPEIAQFLGIATDSLLEAENGPAPIDDPDGLIVKRIFIEMKDKNIPYVSLANFLDIPEQTVNRWRYGKNGSYCDLSTLEMISDFLGVETSFLITGENPPKPVIKEESKLDLILKKIVSINTRLDKIEVSLARKNDSAGERQVQE
ncbi:MAG: helix-turn-helix domain-containing protein [Clostridiales bacterium]|jgi:transcriptional regulator with XRE-family HTH domain|nr:helix-turn-helix domain-containing protein [Clostridiales bacterium]